MSSPIPKSTHELTLWLLDNLKDVRAVGDGLWEGTVPAGFSFADVSNAVDACDQLAGMHDAAARRIEFYPRAGSVYEDIAQFLKNRANRRHAPAVFTLRDIGYTAGPTATGIVPDVVRRYMDAVKLCELLPKMADHVSGDQLHFIKSHDKKLEVQLDFGPDDLKALQGLDQFESHFVVTTHHAEQKRNIVRASLLEIFKGQRRVTLGELLQRFDEFLENVRSSYAMYVAEFSFEKVRAEVEKDNLDSTLKLNKTFSEIQNQLLALPVALVLVGGQMEKSAGLSVKNLVIWLGSVVFTALMLMLIQNQRNAIRAISDEIRLRREKIDAQPTELSARFSEGFRQLNQRVEKQELMLSRLILIVIGSLVFSTGIGCWLSYQPEVLAGVEWLKSLRTSLIKFLGK